MADASVIKEFLVKLGFIVDSASLKKFEGVVAGATKNVAKFAENLEQLYFASVRTRSSVTNIQALDQAARSFGASAGEAKQGLESLGSFLRRNPGGEGFVRALGVKTRDEHGNLRDTSEMLVELGQQFARLPTYLALQRGDQLGLSEQTTLAIMNPEFAARFAKMRADMRAAGFDKAALDAHAFMESLRELGVFLEAFGAQVWEALQVKLGRSMSDLIAWLKDPENVGEVADILNNVVKAAKAVGEAFALMVVLFVKADEATGGLSTKLLGLAVLLNVTGAGGLIGGIFKVSAALYTAAGGAAALEASLAPVLVALAAIAAIFAAYKGSEWLFNNTSAGEALAPSYNPNKSSGSSSGKLSGVSSGKLSGAMQAFMGMGWSKERAAGIVANLVRESGLNPTAEGDMGQAFGVAQWHPDRQHAFEQWSGHSMRGSSLDEQYRFVDYEMRQGAYRGVGALLSAQTSAEAAADLVSRRYERPADREGEASARGAMAASINQKIDIQINGAGDPNATGAAVVRALEVARTTRAAAARVM